VKKEIIIDLIASIIIGCLGLWIMINPGIGVDFFRFYLSLIIIIAGIALIITNKLSKKELFWRYFQGAILIIIGIILFASFHLTLAVVNVILLVWLIIEALLAFVHVFTYIRHRIKIWPIILLFALITAGVAAYIFYKTITQPQSTEQVLIIQLAAIFAFLKGVVGLLDLFNYRKLYKEEDK
jgi:uncharacterized membrane protein HdeD (DUF308 family)